MFRGKTKNRSIYTGGNGVIIMRVVIICICILMFAVCGCAGAETVDTEIAEPLADSSDTSDIIQQEETVEDVPVIEPETPQYDYFGDHTIFDFADFLEEDFPRGSWAANQLAKKYGTPKKCTASYVVWYKVVSTRVEFEDIVISSGYKDHAEFSFFDESLEEWGEYPLSAADMSIEMDISVLIVSDPNVKLPYGLKISQSTKTQVMDAYQEKNPKASNSPGKIPYLSDEIKYGYSTTIAYIYASPDESGSFPDDRYQTGLVIYYFGEDDVLKFIEVQWLIGGD